MLLWQKLRSDRQRHGYNKDQRAPKHKSRCAGERVGRLGETDLSRSREALAGGVLHLKAGREGGGEV